MAVSSTGAGRAVLAVANDPVVRTLCELLEDSGYGVIRSAPVVSAAEILRAPAHCRAHGRIAGSP